VNKTLLSSSNGHVATDTLNADISADFVPDHQLSVDVVASEMSPDGAQDYTSRLTMPSPHGGAPDYTHRLSMPVIRGGLNSNISDILEASGYGTETDIRVDDDYRYAICISVAH